MNTTTNIECTFSWKSRFIAQRCTPCHRFPVDRSVSDWEPRPVIVGLRRATFPETHFHRRSNGPTVGVSLRRRGMSSTVLSTLSTVGRRCACPTPGCVKPGPLKPATFSGFCSQCLGGRIGRNAIQSQRDGLFQEGVYRSI